MITNICGCAGFVEKVTGGRPVPNVLVADYTRIEKDGGLHNVLAIGPKERDAVEEKEANRVAGEILKRLPADRKSREAFIRGGYELARRMSWDVVSRDYLLPVLDEVAKA